ncbi:hypothetical protein ABH973_002398 [Bradyrhizobium ottawaense]|uniref:hypothetical protein n=1 Tax=Bradyrhizobium ottawaense TaxID=931866 RepID=UPI001BAB3FB5|nr:hypothetical protein [Bradyrhizobium diazoefficiens]MBR0925199.1 hypothetical protein [Bradyrhizobium diazoefficiens]
MAPIPRRVKAKPDPATWGDDELLTLAEAAALLWPEGGPVTASTLRTCYRSGLLEVVVVARKVLVTKKAIAAMTEKARRRART